MAQAQDPNAPALDIRGLTKEYRRGVPVLRVGHRQDVPTCITAVIRPIGRGKSTPSRRIHRVVEPTSGEILFHGVDMTRLRRRELRAARRRIGMVFQKYNLVERLSVMENVLSGRLGYMSAFRAWLRRYDRSDI